MHLATELNYMVELIRTAAQQEILPRFGKVTAQPKGDTKLKDIVTEADLAASRYILDRIRQRWPGSYSEEQKYADRFNYDYVWQLDPVDGTKEFYTGMANGYAVNAAFLERQANGTYQSVAGIIYLPSSNTLWYSDGNTITPQPQSDRLNLRGWNRAVDPNDQVERCYQHLAKQLGLNCTIHYGGGSGASLADLLAGKTNLVIHNTNLSKDWDIGMAEPLLKAAGGWICDLTGQPFTYNRPNSPGHDEPYNLNGYVASITFKPAEILPYLHPDQLLVNRL